MAAHALTAYQWILLSGCVSASLYAMVAAVAMPFFAMRRTRAARVTHAASAAAQASHLQHPFANVGVKGPPANNLC